MQWKRSIAPSAPSRRPISGCSTMPSLRRRSANGFRHLFRLVPTLLHLLRRPSPPSQATRAVRPTAFVAAAPCRSPEFRRQLESDVFSLASSDGLRLLIHGFSGFDWLQHTTIKCTSRGGKTRDRKVLENTTIDQSRHNNPPQQGKNSLLKLCSNYSNQKLIIQPTLSWRIN